MLRLEPKQLSLHSTLYNKIPKNHILKNIESVVDFSFINELLAPTYCKNFGRPAKEPEMMCKLLILQHLYNLSDERVIEEANLNLAYMYFLGLNPEDSLPNKSLLAKFRCHRLEDISLDEIITEVVRQCVAKGIIKGTSISIDATHIEANTVKKTPERLMKQLARKIIKTYEDETDSKLDSIEAAPEYKEIEDHNEAKEVMKAYLDDVIEQIESKSSKNTPATVNMIKKAKKIVEDPKFIEQKGVRSIIDEDARVGRKSKKQSFYGYKTEFVMTADERIITSVITADGAYVDGSLAKKMFDQTIKSGLEIKEVYGDKAYFRKPILDTVKGLKADAYIPISQCSYKIDESKFSYNKDSDEWFCSEGNITVNKKKYIEERKNGIYEGYKYYFEIKKCKVCPKRETCTRKSARKILAIGLNTTEFYEISQKQKEEEFLEKYKKRASIEGKNAELKRFHGLSRARGYGLLSVSKQSKLTAIAVNIKRISALISSLYNLIFCFWFNMKTKFVCRIIAL